MSKIEETLALGLKALVGNVKYLEGRLADIHAQAALLESRLCNLEVDKAVGRLDQATARAAEDMTGQDGEDEVNQAAAGLVAARDDKIRCEDPERWAEMQRGA